MRYSATVASKIFCFGLDDRNRLTTQLHLHTDCNRIGLTPVSKLYWPTFVSLPASKEHSEVQSWNEIEREGQLYPPENSECRAYSVDSSRG